MRTSRYLTVLSILLLGLAIPAAAQRTRRPAPRATPKPTPVRQTVSPVVAAAKQLVANQLHNVQLFVDKMGPIAVTLESLDKEASAGRLKKEQVDKNAVHKQKMVEAIRELRDGLLALETEFRTKPQLAQYLSRIQGISTLCAQSEDHAIAGRFVAAKDPLRQVTIKLNDTMAVLPGSVATSTTASSSPNQPRTIPAVNDARPVVNRNVSTTAAKRDVSVGMSTAEVLSSAWGSPNNKRTSTTPNGTTEVWLYPGGKTIYFFNGKVTRIVQ